MVWQRCADAGRGGAGIFDELRTESVRFSTAHFYGDTMRQTIFLLALFIAALLAASGNSRRSRTR
jgi:hypothetical protein